jgi:hypothetical protein
MEPDEVQYDVDPLNLDDLDTDPYSKGT